ncbi:hypothetical protein PG644_05425 [Riemerella anatipestifer]|nr:hypothetical protein [Riemerella anatipestifer]
MIFNKLNNQEIKIISIIVGVLVALLLGYLFGETQFYNFIGHRVDEDFVGSTVKVFKFNYLLFICGFIVSSGITYLLLNNKVKNNH